MGRGHAARASIALSVLACLLACDAGTEHALWIEVAAPSPVAVLSVSVEPAGREAASSEIILGGRTPTAAAPARVAVSFDAPTMARVYIVAFGDDGSTAAAGRCYSVDGIVRDSVLLVALGDDVDHDGWSASGAVACLSIDGSPCASFECAAQFVDCDDADETVHPVQLEVCGGDSRLRWSARAVRGRGRRRVPAMPSRGSGSDGVRLRRRRRRSPPGRGRDSAATASTRTATGSTARATRTWTDRRRTSTATTRNPTRAPSLPEVCTTSGDPVDEDCDSFVDEGTCAPNDNDGDGATGDVDCDDCNPAIRPGARDRCGDGVDQDCDGSDPPCLADADGDGYLAAASGGDDCNDSDARVHPGAIENCMTPESERCTVNESCAADTDGDHWLEPPPCEGNPMVSPDAVEVCNGIDDDCDSVVDEVFAAGEGCVATGPGTRETISFSDDTENCGGCGITCAGPTRRADRCDAGACSCSASSDGAPCADTERCCTAADGGQSGCFDLEVEPGRVRRMRSRLQRRSVTAGRGPMRRRDLRLWRRGRLHGGRDGVLRSSERHRRVRRRSIQRVPLRWM